MANWIWYGEHFLGQYGTTAARRIDFAGDTIKCALTLSAHTPNQDTHNFFDDLTNELSGTGYTAGGVTLAGKGLSYDGTSNELRFDFDDPAWGPGATLSDIKNAHLYKDTGSAATSPLIAYTIFASAQAVSNGTFTIDVDTTTVLKITAASS